MEIVSIYIVYIYIVNCIYVAYIYISLNPLKAFVDQLWLSGQSKTSRCNINFSR